MRWKPLLYLGVVPCLLALPVCGQTIPPKSISLQIKTSSVPVRDWPQMLNWQKVPDGVGEMLVFPNPPATEDFIWAKQRLLGTELGLLSRDTDDTEGQWQIVPSLYKQSVRIVGESQNLLWLEQIGQGLVALNRDLAVARRLPDVKGHCIAIEPQGFWCLDGFDHNHHHGATALVEYSAEGKERRRFVLQNFSLLPKPTPGIEKKPTAFSSSGISWAAVDAEAVWVSITDYHFGGLDGGDVPHNVNETQLGRLDRITGKFTLLPWAPAENKGKPNHYGDVYKLNQPLNFPAYIQWLTQVDEDTWDVYQLDKRTLQVSRLIRLLAPGYDLTTKDKNLWLQSRERGIYERDMRIYSRENFDPIPLGEAGTPPGRMFGSRPEPWTANSPFCVGILGDDENGIWLGAPTQTLLHAADEGKSTAYDVRSLLWSSSSRFTTHTPAGEFLRDSSEQLVQIQLNGEARRVSFSGNWPQKGDPDRGYLWFLAATRQRVWYYTDGGQLVTLAPDLSQPHEIAQGPLFGDESSLWRHQHVSDNRGSVAVGDHLYAWADSGHLLRIDGVSGEVKVVESWMRRFPKDESQTSPRRTLTGRNQSAFALQDGRISFTFSEQRNYMSVTTVMFMDAGQIDKAHFFIFDPAKDTWQESDASPAIQPIPAGGKLYGCDATQLYEWRGDNWTAIGKRPLPSPPAVSGQPQSQPVEAKVVATQKYFYQETALGLYRLPWSQIGGQ
ncbi:hypothetical protein IAD21_01162 [Abditibacteriota bacterium]|nr:hypothetical protein IAD21_01162 [Abditibacteriota bacterium]